MLIRFLVDPEQEITWDCPAQSLTNKDPISKPEYEEALKTPEDSVTDEAMTILPALSSQ